MNRDMLEARRELLAERGIRERFALLVARPDWPPERREPVPGLSDHEAREWRTFRQEVDKRMWGEELYPARDDAVADRLIVEPRDAASVGALLEKLTDEVRRGAAIREATLEDALPVWRHLHGSLVERLRADGFDTNHPLLDWANMERSLREFDSQLTQFRLDDAERTSFQLVPDPDGRPISLRERDDAEDRMLADHDRPLSDVAAAPSAEHLPSAQRGSARDAVERQNALPVSDAEARDYRLAPQESRLDWLDEARVSAGPAPTMNLEDRLDWLLPNKRDQALTEQERDRER
jgi:hypothetical protein